MEWKKEKISASELEKRQKEYMNEALSMMKRGVTVSVTVQQTAPVSEPEPPVHETELGEQKELVQPEEPAHEEAVRAEDKQETAAEQSEELPEEQPEEMPHDDEPEQCEEPDEDDKYGVYTADEIVNSEYKSEGLKKAAEILEEMTRSTEMMKKLADSDDDSPECADGTTDFPDFSCDMPEEGERFREEDEECEEEKLVPADE